MCCLSAKGRPKVMNQSDLVHHRKSTYLEAPRSARVLVLGVQSTHGPVQRPAYSSDGGTNVSRSAEDLDRRFPNTLSFHPSVDGGFPIQS